MNIPDPKELEKELNQYLHNKYGEQVKLGVAPLSFPSPRSDKFEDEKKDKSKIISKIKFDLKPEELEAYLNNYVVKQEEAKGILATKICTHFNRIQYWEENKNILKPSGVGYIKNNILMIGPTGVGKTYLIKLIAEKIGVPFVKGDATKFSETGYVGGDVEDMVRDLMAEANDDIEYAQYGIVYLDEIDKIASSQNLVGPDVSRTGVQRALLKLMEETEVNLKVPHDFVSQMEAFENYRRTGKREKRVVNTANILFIMSGAFNELEKIIEKRINSQGIGFISRDTFSKREEFDYFKYVKSEDFIKYGFESEFIGRLPVIVTLDELDGDDLYKILKNPNNPIIKGKKMDFKAYGIDLKFKDQALYSIALNAHQEKTGARGLVSAVEKVLLKFEKRLPSTSINHLVVTEEMVKNPQDELNKILSNQKQYNQNDLYQLMQREERGKLRTYIKEREKDFAIQFQEELTEELIDLITDMALESGGGIDEIYQEIKREQKEILNFEETFYSRNHIKLRFGHTAVIAIIKKAFKENSDPYQICERTFKNYELGLKLIKDQLKDKIIQVEEEALDNPDEYLNRMIRSTYQ
ncbi:MAG: AAA family ATPase [Thermodesulfobacteriota bacterium]|nr:AAA family ATPase [Thermodesulfobacteriota bacterium]